MYYHGNKCDLHHKGFTEKEFVIFLTMLSKHSLELRNINIFAQFIFFCFKISVEPQVMDRPFIGTTIEGPREQEIKPGSTITLTCRATISTVTENEPNGISFNTKDKEGTHRTKRVIWSVNDTPITLQV